MRLRSPLPRLAGGPGWRIGYEAGASSEPASYAAMHLYGGRMASLIGACFPQPVPIPADEILTDLRARKTRVEIERIRTACEIAGEAFAEAKRSVSPGVREIDVANRARNCFSSGMERHPDVQRADGFAWCMSGPNSALGCGSLCAISHAAKSRAAIWCWFTATLMRTATGPTSQGPGAQESRTHAREIFSPRSSPLARRPSRSIRPGVSGASVDRAARQKMQEHGFAAAFKHSTGHGVGFGAINAEARPRLHPASPDVLEPGMIFNVEPAAYFEGYGGVRHCDMIAVTEQGCDLLTPFQCNKEEVFESSPVHATTQE